ncbi:hypothetical protein FHG87_013816 [Trinorchestia longiramus]|nr:hypothetical protein FHG87_013816 [Trinorchestia longiramus]
MWLNITQGEARASSTVMWLNMAQGEARASSTVMWLNMAQGEARASSTVMWLNTAQGEVVAPVGKCSPYLAQINAYERNWKIQTNANKFKLIAFNRRKKQEVHVDGTPLSYDESGKVLGLYLSSQGYTSHITHRKAIAQNNLSRLYRFKHIHPDTTRKFYLAYVRSALIYPVIPLHTLSPTTISKLQRTQNKATRSITNTEWHDFNTSAQLHRQTKLPPIDTLLHEHAKRIWNNIENMHPQLYIHLTFPHKTRQVPHKPLPKLENKNTRPPQHPNTHDTPHRRP